MTNIPALTAASFEIASTLADLPEILRSDPNQALLTIESHLDLPALQGRMRELLRVWAASPFAMLICVREPTLLSRLLNSGDLDRVYRDIEWNERIGEPLTTIDSETRLMKALRLLRRREMLRIVWRDITGVATLNETLMDLSNLAQSCVEMALQWCYREGCQRFGTPLNTAGEAQPMVVLGMGKLGGHELNFSSDIDLIFTFAEVGATDGIRPLDNSQFFIRLGQRLIKILSEITSDGFVFRVDMRLRPFGEAGPLAISFNAMEDYYQQHGRDWERYALIKARVVAGDRKAGDELLARLRPFVYRRYLDYGAFEALRKMKALINAEIKRRRMGDNIKLGAGGIREVEFIGQAFQLIRGGRDTTLQIRPLQDVLRRLEERQQLPSHVVGKLLAAYQFLRRTENRLQMIADQQTHVLPKDELQRTRLAFAMGYADWETFRKQLDLHRKQVREQFEGVFATPQVEFPAEGKDETGTLLLKLWLGMLDELQATAVLKQAGFRQPEQAYFTLLKYNNSQVYRLKSALGRERMDRLMPLLLAAVGQSSQPDVVLPRLLSLTEAIVRRSVYIALLAEHPLALSQLVKLSSASPWISQYLCRHPVLLDELLDPRRLYAPLNRKELSAHLRDELSHVNSMDLEALMDRVRYFKHANVLRVAAADVMGVLPLMKVSDQLSWIAETVVEESLAICHRQLVTKHGQPRCVFEEKEIQPGFVVVGYGKLGGLELGYGSDLDIVFLHDSAGNQQWTRGEQSIANAVFFVRLGRRMIQFLTALTPAGKLYDVDSRLRPSGASGMLVSSLQTFDDYQHNQAWTWEHQALVRARAVAGDPQLVERFGVIRREVLCLQRATQALRQDVRGMRLKMWEQIATPSGDQFDLKKDPGGIIDIEFMVQYQVLANAHQHLCLAEYTDNNRILEALENCGILIAQDAQSMREIYRIFRDRAHELSLQGEPSIVNRSEFSLESAEIKRLWRVMLDAA